MDDRGRRRRITAEPVQVAKGPLHALAEVAQLAHTHLAVLEQGLYVCAQHGPAHASTHVFTDARRFVVADHADYDSEQKAKSSRGNREPLNADPAPP
jgi:hypothetical protein